MDDLFSDLPPEHNAAASSSASGSSTANPTSSFGATAMSLKPRTTLASSCKCLVKRAGPAHCCLPTSRVIGASFHSHITQPT